MIKLFGKENEYHLTEVEKYEIWERFKEEKNERCPELDQLILDVIKWLKKSKEAEQDLAHHDHNAEEQFAKLHRIRHRNMLICRS